jgi:hypothetical protein
MITYTTLDGATFRATGPEDLLHQMREDSRDPRESDLAFRIATARAAALQTGYGIRSNTPAQLVEDLISAGLIKAVDHRPWPSFGQGATICHYSDRTACTIVEVSPSAKTITLQPDHAELDHWKPEMIPGGFAAHCTNNSTQRYRYARNAKAPIVKARLRKDGRYRTPAGERVIEGRHHFHDYNF